MYNLTLEYEGKKLTMNWMEDANVDDMKSIFTTIMAWMTFSPTTIDELFGEEK